MRSLRESRVVVGCSICRALATGLEKREELDITEDMEITIQAELTHLKDQDSLRRGSGDRDIYRLDFRLEKEQMGSQMKMETVQTHLHTFALKPTSKSNFKYFEMSVQHNSSCHSQISFLQSSMAGSIDPIVVLFLTRGRVFSWTIARYKLLAGGRDYCSVMYHFSCRPSNDNSYFMVTMRRCQTYCHRHGSNF